MADILLTANSVAILGPIAKFLGWILDKIYILVKMATGIENIGISIILLTIVILGMLFPLTLKQQKFSMFSQKMQPELNAIRKKYEGKRDQQSVAAMQQETSLVYKKYGVSPAGSCVQILIQFPILLSLYQVFSRVPAYITSVRSSFDGLVDGIIKTSGYRGIMKGIVSSQKLSVSVDFSDKHQSIVNNYIVDVLYKLPQDGWKVVYDKFPKLHGNIDSTIHSIKQYNYFFGVNISDSPLTTIKAAMADKAYLVVLVALLIPVLSGLFQYLNVKMMPQPDNGSEQMANQMKTMNNIMPIISLVMTFSVPSGLGIYWATSGLVRVIQQMFINKHFEKIDIDDIIKQNELKLKKQREKMGIYENQINNAAHYNTKGIKSKADLSGLDLDKMNEASSMKKEIKPGSLAAKANAVQEFNDRNSRK
ncbi:YidC/Oxa1 family membrane protein insertase [Lachnobacterium bovis]|uniref:YidC/Oxa1 family membrane protein insertase n=1 Tax=Lachnobacterium bovis TaxID=140626 RepID=A0A1H9UCQ3_9FIRM|nr:YidC/Oxa1 family membrane protein insertase [Lachnobacterium bovis]SES07245.1 YidC/Oxa1 family membrane protein insertase [Lachnobacterium bovis]